MFGSNFGVPTAKDSKSAGIAPESRFKVSGTESGVVITIGEVHMMGALIPVGSTGRPRRRRVLRHFGTRTE